MPLRSRLAHALDVDRHRLGAGRDGLAEGRDRLAAQHLDPEILVALHEREGRTHRLGDHRGQIGGPGPRAYLMPTQPRFGDGKPIGDRRAGDPQVADVATGPRPLGIDQQVLDQARRERQLTAQRLVQAAAVERAQQRAEQQARDGALVEVPRVGGGDQVGLAVQHRPGQAWDPVGCRRDRVGLQQHQRPRAQPVGDLERRAQGGAAPRHAVERYGDPLAGRGLVLGHDGRQPAGRGALARGVGRARVAHHERGLQRGKVAGQPVGGNGQHAVERLGAVVGEQPDGNIRPADARQRGDHRFGQLGRRHGAAALAQRVR
jgi:hypothetical protein